MPNVFLWQGNYYKTCLSNLDPRPEQKKNEIKFYVKRWARRDSITSYFNFIHKISIIFNFTSWNVGRSNTEFSQTDCACLQMRAFFVLCSKRKCWLKSGYFWKYLFIVELLPCWFFGPLTLFENLAERYTQSFNFRIRNCLNRLWHKHFSVYTSIFKNLTNPPRQRTCYQKGTELNMD